jgi:hypothetical protein
MLNTAYKLPVIKKFYLKSYIPVIALNLAAMYRPMACSLLRFESRLPFHPGY